MKIDTEAIEYMLTQLNHQDMKQINVPTSRLKKLKHHPKSLSKSRLQTMIQLQTYMNQHPQYQPKIKCQSENTHYVGIDVGISNLITASSQDRSQTVKIKTCDYPLLKNAIDAYNRKIIDINRDFNCHRRLNKAHHITRREDYKEAVQTLIDTIDTPLMQMIKHIVTHVYPRHTVYVIGINHLQIEFYATHQVILHHIIDTFYRVFETYPELKGTVVTFNEKQSSIECPKCHQKHHQSRTSDNQFKCRHCGFKHKDDDIVASCNIVNNYLRTKKGTI